MSDPGPPFASCPHKITSYPCLRAGEARGKFYARRSLPAFPHNEALLDSNAMPKKKTIRCNNRGVCRLLTDAKSGALSAPGREEDRRVFFDEHLDNCRGCRDEMIDHANQLALNETAEEICFEVEGVVERLGETAKQLRVIARDAGVPFDEVVVRLLRGNLNLTTELKSPRALFVAAPTEP